MESYTHHNLSLRLKISIVLIALIIVISGIFGLISYYNSSTALKENIVQSLINRSVDSADLVSHRMNDFKTIIEGIADRSEIKTMNWNIQKPLLTAEAKRLGVKRFQVLDLNSFAHSTNGKNMKLENREYFKKALQGMTYVSEPFKGALEDDMIIVFATPIRGNDGKVIGVLGASINPVFLLETIKTRRVGKTGYGFIINKEGMVVAHPDESLILSMASVTKDLKEYPEIRDLIDIEKKMIDGKTGFGLYKYNGIDKCASYAPISGTQWSIALTAPKQEVFAEINTLRYQFMTAILLAIIISIAFVLLVLRYISRLESIEMLKRNVEQSNQLLKESEEMDKLRTQFFANISHEFRTPLNVILGALQLMETYIKGDVDNNTNKFARHLKSIKQNCQRLLRLVNNLIDATRIDAGYFDMHIKNCNIVSVVEDITLSINEYTSEKGINLIFDTEMEDKIVACDTDMIERVMLNLLSNAIKFTEAGGSIFVNIYDKDKSVLISVKDTGIGIPEDKQALVFERFRQVEQSLTRSHEGSGIGLSLVKSLVELHGGKISLQSAPGSGSEFIVDLPVITMDSEGCTGQEANTGINTGTGLEKIDIEFSDVM